MITLFSEYGNFVFCYDLLIIRADYELFFFCQSAACTIGEFSFSYQSCGLAICFWTLVQLIYVCCSDHASFNYYNIHIKVEKFLSFV